MKYYYDENGVPVKLVIKNDKEEAEFDLVNNTSHILYHHDKKYPLREETIKNVNRILDSEKPSLFEQIIDKIKTLFHETIDSDSGGKLGL